MGRNAMSEEHNANESARSESVSELNRRTLLRRTGGALGASAIGLPLIGQAEATSSLPNEVTVKNLVNEPVDYQITTKQSITANQRAENNSIAAGNTISKTVTDDTNSHRYSSEVTVLSVDDGLKLVHHPNDRKLTVSGNGIYKLDVDGQFTPVEVPGDAMINNHEKEYSTAYHDVSGDEAIFSYTGKLQSVTFFGSIFAEFNRPVPINTSFSPSNDDAVAEFIQDLKQQPNTKQEHIFKSLSDAQQTAYSKAVVPQSAEMNTMYVSSGKVTTNSRDYVVKSLDLKSTFGGTAATFIHHAGWSYDGNSVSNITSYANATNLTFGVVYQGATGYTEALPNYGVASKRGKFSVKVIGWNIDQDFAKIRFTLFDGGNVGVYTDTDLG